MEFLLHRGDQANGGRDIKASDLLLLWRVLVQTVFRASPARARFTLRLLLETLARRPQAFKEACSFAVTHKALSEYMDASGPEPRRGHREDVLGGRLRQTRKLAK